MFQLMKVLNGDPFIDYDDSEMIKIKLKTKLVVIIIDCLLISKSQYKY